MHVLAAIETSRVESEYYDGDAEFSYLAQVILCSVDLLIMYIGRKTASAITKRSIIPVESQVGTPLQLTYPVAGVQPSTMVHMLPQSP